MTETCNFFVDDSNIWIEAQKFAASGNHHIPKLTDSDRDPRLRIDIGKLLNTLRRGRKQGDSSLYGSRPPPNDSVWAAFGGLGFNCKIYDRVRGREKEVDNSMAADLVASAVYLDTAAKYVRDIKTQKCHTTFVAITGDRDMLPPITRVLECGIKVELWAWESGISKAYSKLSSHGDLFSVRLLNDIFSEISFTNYRSTRKSKLEYGKTLVLCDLADPDVDNLNAYVCDRLNQLGRLFYVTQSQTEMEFFVEFGMVKEVKDLEEIFAKTRELFGDLATVLSWPEYADRFDKTPPPAIECGNMYSPLFGNGDLQVVEDVVDQSPSQSAAAELEVRKIQEGQGRENIELKDTDGWEMVIRSDRGKEHRRAMRHTQPCPHRIRCQSRGQCGYRHTKTEEDLFRDNPSVDFKRWKTRMCNRKDCQRGQRCPFAHSQREAWCLKCNQEGHYIETCRFLRH